MYNPGYSRADFKRIPTDHDRFVLFEYSLSWLVVPTVLYPTDLKPFNSSIYQPGSLNIA